VKEGHAAVPDPRSRPFVDQTEPSGACRVQRGFDVIGSVGEVMQAGTVAVEETAHRSVSRQRAQQLDMTLPDPEQHHLGPLILEDLAVLYGHPEALRVERHGLFEVLDGHPNVIDLPKHGREG
jgi:hypothetical protein